MASVADSTGSADSPVPSSQPNHAPGSGQSSADSGVQSPSSSGYMGIFAMMAEDVRTILDRDPAAKSTLEVVLCYAGLHALWAHRMIHPLWVTGNCWLRLAARLWSQWSRFWTGIEIHPGAQIGRRFFIDHGTGVVIGETTIIHDDVTIFQGVTLGGTGKEKDHKRHPTLMDWVVVGAGAKILGNITVGAYSAIGASSVVLQNIPEKATVVGVPGRIVSVDGRRLDSIGAKEKLSVKVRSLQRHIQEIQLEMVDTTKNAPAPASVESDPDDPGFPFQGDGI